MRIEGGAMVSPAMCKKYPMLPSNVDLSIDERKVFADMRCLIPDEDDNNFGQLVEVPYKHLALLEAMEGGAELRGCSPDELFNATWEYFAKRSTTLTTVRIVLCRHLETYADALERGPGNLQYPAKTLVHASLQKFSLLRLFLGGLSVAVGEAFQESHQLSGIPSFLNSVRNFQHGMF